MQIPSQQAEGTLRSSLRGVLPVSTRIIFNDDHDFHESVRPRNLNYPYRPFAVIYPEEAEGVSAIVRWASKHGVALQARSGGHDYINKGIGAADGAIVVDMTAFQQLSVDEAGIATVGPGLQLRVLVQGLHDNGRRCLPHGSCPSVGVGGHATVGGLGALGRVHGVMLDAMVQAQVVLASGEIVSASQNAHLDLFWAVRGAAASFGIVTEFRFQTIPEPQSILPFSYMTKSGNTNQLETFKAFHSFIQDPHFHPKLSIRAMIAKSNLMIGGIFMGPEAEFSALQIQDWIPNLDSHTVGPSKTWIEYMSEVFDSFGEGGFNDQPSYFHSEDVVVPYRKIPSAADLNALFDHLSTADAGTDRWMALVDVQGGVANSVPVGATAYPHRDTLYFFSTFIQTPSPTPKAAYEFSRNATRLLQGGDGGPDKYLSYAGTPVFGIHPRQYYGEENHARLQLIKTSVDPLDVFSTPTGIKPLNALNNLRIELELSAS
ncbi:hypothetical protein N7507_001802 [Penicillium longicatenatum]|nr:hypothetical protein N7507_001802 [Penicillium longicatenatum]